MALINVGKVLFYCPRDPDGFWINKTVANALNQKDSEPMRAGFYIAIRRSRGVHKVDPTGKPEKDLALKYRQKAEETENAGYYRLATTLREVANTYDKQAERIIARYNTD